MFGSKTLVQGNAAQQFFDFTQTESGLNTLLGDPRNVHPSALPAYQGLRIQLAQDAKKVMALVDDPTRSEPEKHAAAKKLAESNIDRATKAKAEFIKVSDQLHDDANREAESALGANQSRAFVQSVVLDYLRNVAKGPEGLAKIREAMKESKDAASVMWWAPSFLLGLPKDMHDELRMEAMEVAAPDAFKKLNAAHQLSELLPKLDKLVTSVKMNFYNEQLAKAAARRVEV